VEQVRLNHCVIGGDSSFSSFSCFL